MGGNRFYNVSLGNRFYNGGNSSREGACNPSKEHTASEAVAGETQQLNGDWRVGPLAVAAATLPPRSDVPQENLRRGKPTRAYWLCAVKPRRANPASRPPRHFPGWSGAVASCAGAAGRVSSWRGAAGTRGTERGGVRGRASVDWRSAGRSRRAAATLNIVMKSRKSVDLYPTGIGSNDGRCVQMAGT